MQIRRGPAAVRGRVGQPLAEAGKVPQTMNPSQKTCHRESLEDDGKVLKAYVLRTFYFERRFFAVNQKTLSLPLFKLTLVSSLVALSVVGSYIKIPSPTGTVALDSLPGFVGALSLGYQEGALIAFLGHMLTSLNVGFPLGVLFHLVIAGEMALIALAFRFLFLRWGYPLAIGVTTALNGVIAPLSLVPFFGWGFFTGIVVSLLVTSAANLVIASLVHRVLLKR